MTLIIIIIIIIMWYAGGLLQLHSVTGDTQWLDWSQQLQASLDELFWDETSGKPQTLKCF